MKCLKCLIYLNLMVVLSVSCKESSFIEEDNINNSMQALLSGARDLLSGALAACYGAGDGDELSRRMEEYYTEFEENGIDNIKVEN